MSESTLLDQLTEIQQNYHRISEELQRVTELISQGAGPSEK
jgi:hypothetical protein